MKRVLIVDDDAHILYGLNIVLSENYKTVTARDAYEAIRILESDLSEPIDAILLDIYMPGMDGVGFLKELAERKIEIPVVTMSASIDLDVLLERLNVQYFIRKPFDIEEVETKVEASLAAVS